MHKATYFFIPNLRNQNYAAYFTDYDFVYKRTYIPKNCFLVYSDEIKLNA